MNLPMAADGTVAGAGNVLAVPNCTGLYGVGCSFSNNGQAVPPRNGFQSPGFWNIDFVAMKNFKLTERFNLQFRGEFYNLFNHHNNYVLGSNLDIEPGTSQQIQAERGTPSAGCVYCTRARRAAQHPVRSEADFLGRLNKDLLYLGSLRAPHFLAVCLGVDSCILPRQATPKQAPTLRYNLHLTVVKEKHIGFLGGKIFVTALSVFLLFCLTSCGSGTTGNDPTAPTWDYTALGDSLASGTLAQEGYVARYASYTNQDTGSNIKTINLGVPGWHSGDLLNAIQTDQILRNHITTSKIVTWDIGGDDLANAHDHFTQGTCGGTDNEDCFRTAVSTFEQNWSSIITELLKLRATNNTIIRTMDIYNPYVASDMQKGIFTTVEPYLDQVNNYIHTTAAAHNIPVAAVHQAFNGTDGTQDPGAQGLIAADGFHPNDAGHKVIADQFRVLGYAPLH